MITTAVTETAHKFGRNGTLAGVLTRSSGREQGCPVLILGAGIIHKVGSSRVSVELARTLASRGHPALRFDLSGVGDSDRAGEASLEDAVTSDIADAIDFLLEEVDGTEVCLLGFCSGADNGLYMARDEPRVKALALFDPSIPETRGFRRRRLAEKVRHLEAWQRFALRSVRRLRSSGPGVETPRPPGYYGLLALTPEETDQASTVLADRHVPQLFVLSNGVHHYCNAPEQVAESRPSGFRPELVAVEWRPDFDHILSSSSQRRDLCAMVVKWLDSVTGDIPSTGSRAAEGSSRRAPPIPAPSDA